MIFYNGKVSYVAENKCYTILGLSCNIHTF